MSLTWSVAFLFRPSRRPGAGRVQQGLPSALAERRRAVLPRLIVGVRAAGEAIAQRIYESGVDILAVPGLACVVVAVAFRIPSFSMQNP